MIKTNAKIDELIQKSTLRINNSINDPDISASLSQFGYTPEKLGTGKLILNDAITANQTYYKEYGDVAKAQESKTNELELSQQEYLQHLSICRVVFKNDLDAYFTLKLNGKRERSFSSAINQMINFYQILLDNEVWLGKASNFGCTAERLESSLNKVNQTANYQQQIMLEKGEAQQATVDRDIMVDRLNDWMHDFKQIAKVALFDKPQLLEKLQIIVKKK